MADIEKLRDTDMSVRKLALFELEQMKADRSGYVLIHYSSEPFDKTTVITPRALSIAVRQVSGSETISFGIHTEAERLGIAQGDIKENYNILEAGMLEKFMGYLENNADKTFIHWRMRDAKYGFEAIKNRYEALTGKSADFIDRIKKTDLAETFKKIYGRGYIADPKLVSLFKKNNLNMDGALSSEKSMIQEGNFAALNTALLRKIDNIATVKYIVLRQLDYLMDRKRAA